MEQRRHRRFQVKGGIVAILNKPGDLTMRVGLDLDISEGGLGFYLVGGDEQQWEGELSIALLGYDGFIDFMENIPCRIVYDLIGFPLRRGSMKIRRCGVEFVALSEIQKLSIEEIIEINNRREKA